MEQVIRNSLKDRMDSLKAKIDAWAEWWSKSHWWGRPSEQAYELEKTTEKQSENKQTTSKKQAKNNQDKDRRYKIEDISNKIEEENNTSTMCNKLHDEYWFDLFWNKYPNKKDKKKAKDKFNKLSLEKRKQAIEWIDRLRKSDQRQRWFIPMPTTYLNWERWEDEVESKSIWIEQMKERERQRIREEAQEILNRNNSSNAENSYQTFNRRWDISCE